MDKRRPQQPDTASPGTQGAPPATGPQMSAASPKPQGGARSGQDTRRSGASEPTLQPSMTDDPLEAARTLASEATTVAESLSSDLQQAVKATTRAAKAQASEFGADVGHELSRAAEEQKMRGVDAMQVFTRAVDTAAAEFEDHSPMVARYVRDAARQVDGLSNNIRGRSVNDLMQAATDLARQQPALFFAGALAAGFALSRFLKSSAPRAEPATSHDMGSGAGRQQRTAALGGSASGARGGAEGM